MLKLNNHGVVTHKNSDAMVRMYNGLPHYIGGPSVIKDDGTKMFHIMGVKYSEDDYWDIVTPVLAEMI